MITLKDVREMAYNNNLNIVKCHGGNGRDIPNTIKLGVHLGTYGKTFTAYLDTANSRIILSVYRSVRGGSDIPYIDTL